MKTTSPLPQDVWERTPAKAQASIRALKARVAALAATVPRLLERLRMDAQHASPPPSREAPTPRNPDSAVRPVAASLGGNQGTTASAGHGCRGSTGRRCSRSSPRPVSAVGTPGLARLASRSGRREPHCRLGTLWSPRISCTAWCAPPVGPRRERPSPAESPLEAVGHACKLW